MLFEEYNANLIHSQWNTTFETPSAASMSVGPPTQQGSGMRHMSNAGGELNPLPDMIGTSMLPLPPMGSAAAAQQHLIAQQQFAPVQSTSFVSPSMWQESVASVYEGGLKRSWGYDGGMEGGKRR